VSAERLRRAVDRLLNLVLVADVAAEVVDPLREPVGDAPGKAGNLGAGVDRLSGDRLADAGAGAGDEDPAALEVG